MPTELGLLSNIVRLYLGMNALYEEIPSEIFDLTTLEVFSIEHNAFYQEIPSELGLLTNLQILGLADNYFFGTLPEELSNLENLEYFLIFTNYDLTGPVPAEYNQLTNLAGIYMAETGITDDPDEDGLNRAFCWEGKEYEAFEADCDVKCSCCTIDCWG